MPDKGFVIDMNIKLVLRVFYPALTCHNDNMFCLYHI